MNTYQVMDSNNRVYVIDAVSDVEACRRIADLHGVQVTAWRYPPVELVIGLPEIVG